MSPPPDRTLDDPQKIIADLRRELTRRTAERDEALTRETATAEVLQVINASPGDLAPVFEAILEKAMALCEAEFGILNTYDGENFHRAAARGVPPIRRKEASARAYAIRAGYKAWADNVRRDGCLTHPGPDGRGFVSRWRPGS